MRYAIRFIDGHYRIYDAQRERLLAPIYRRRGTAARVLRHLQAREESAA